MVAPAKIVDQAMPKRCSLPSSEPSGPPAAENSAHVASPRLATRRARHGRGGDQALAAVAHHQAVGVGQGEGDDEQQEDLEQVGPRVGVLERVGGVGVEEAAAVGAQLLDGLLRGDRAALHDLVAARDGGDRRRLGEVLDHPTDEQHDRRDDRQRQQDAHDAAHQVDPEVAEQVGGLARDATDQGDRDGQPDGGRDEVLHGQTHGLHGVAGTGLTGVRLPVGVRRERDRGVDGRVPVHRPAQRPRQPALHLDEQEQADDRHDRERHDRDRVAGPALLGARVDADEPVDETLDAPVLLVGEDAVHPGAERHVRQGEERSQGEHGRAGGEGGVHDLSSEPVRPDEGVEEVTHEGQPHGSGDHVFPHAAHDTPGRTASGRP